MNILASSNLELPPLVPYRGPYLDRRLRVDAPVHRPLHHLRQHLGGTERDFLDFDLRLAALFAAHDEHVFRRINPQPAPPFGARGLACDYRRPPLTPLPFDRLEDVNGLDS